MSSGSNGVRGSFYHYNYNGSAWQVNQKFELQLPEDENEIHFGRNVAVSEDWIITASENNDQFESIIFYKRENNNWIRHSKLTNSIPDVGFGWHLAIEGNTAVVGSIIDLNSTGEKTGIAYVFEFNPSTDTWGVTQILAPDELEPGDFFGNYIYIQGNTLAISARDDDDNGFDSGAVYIYQKNQGAWTLQTKIVPNDANEEDHVGYRVNGDGNRIIISGYGTNNETGSVYIYRKNQMSEWVLETRLIADDLEEGDRFGSSIAIEGNRAIVGARNRNQNTGTVFVFENPNDAGVWTQTRVFEAPGGTSMEARFGSGLDYQNGRLVIGAPWSNEFRGAAYAFEFDETVSVKEQNIVNFDIYPNPSQDFIQLDLQDRQIKIIDIYNMLGVKVASHNYAGDPLDIRNLTTGIYILKSTEDNIITELGKFVKL